MSSGVTVGCTKWFIRMPAAQQSRTKIVGVPAHILSSYTERGMYWVYVLMKTQPSRLIVGLGTPWPLYTGGIKVAKAHPARGVALGRQREDVDYAGGHIPVRRLRRRRTCSWRRRRRRQWWGCWRVPPKWKKGMLPRGAHTRSTSPRLCLTIPAPTALLDSEAKVSALRTI